MPTSSVPDRRPTCVSSSRRSKRVLATTVVSLTRSSPASVANRDCSPHAHRCGLRHK